MAGIVAPADSEEQAIPHAIEPGADGQREKPCRPGAVHVDIARHRVPHRLHRRQHHQRAIGGEGDIHHKAADCPLERDEGEPADACRERRQRIEPSDPVVHGRRLPAHRPDQLDGAEQKQCRPGKEVQSHAEGCDRGVRLIELWQGGVPLLHRARRNGPAIEGENVRPEDRGRHPHHARQRDAGPFQRSFRPPGWRHGLGKGGHRGLRGSADDNLRRRSLKALPLGKIRRPPPGPGRRPRPGRRQGLGEQHGAARVGITASSG